MYEVVSGNRKQAAQTRQEAVEMARTWSRTRRSAVRVVRQGGGESMVYRHGTLQEALRRAQPFAR